VAQRRAFVAQRRAFVAQRRAFEHSRIKAPASTQRRVSSRLVELRTVPNQAPASAFPAAQRCALSSLVELSNRAESSSRARIPGRAASRFRTEPNQAPAHVFPAAQRRAFEQNRTKLPRAYYGGASSPRFAAVRGASTRRQRRRHCVRRMLATVWSPSKKLLDLRYPLRLGSPCVSACAHDAFAMLRGELRANACRFRRPQRLVAAMALDTLFSPSISRQPSARVLRPCAPSERAAREGPDIVRTPCARLVRSACEPAVNARVHPVLPPGPWDFLGVILVRKPWERADKGWATCVQGGCVQWYAVRKLCNDKGLARGP
jgi:hypothetical protein